MISVGHYLAVSAVLFTLGVLGIFINRKNIIVILMAIELILLAVNINLVAFSAALNDLVGQVFAMFVLFPWLEGTFLLCAQCLAKIERGKQIEKQGGVL